MVYYTGKQFAIFRIIFGIYLSWHFLSLLTYATEIFGRNGVIPDPHIIPTWWLMPRIFNLLDISGILHLVLIGLTAASVMFAIGFYRRTMSIIIWLGWVFLFNRNVFISNPGIPYVGWLLSACVVIPIGEGFSVYPKLKKWEMPVEIYWGAWFLLMVGYSVSGIHKLRCSSWLDGSALHHVLSSLLAHDNYLVAFLLDHQTILKFATYGSLFLESTALFLGMFYNLRKWYWLALTMMHIGILFLINFSDLTFGMLAIHLFVFDNRWLGKFPFCTNWYYRVARYV